MQMVVGRQHSTHTGQHQAMQGGDAGAFRGVAHAALDGRQGQRSLTATRGLPRIAAEGR